MTTATATKPTRNTISTGRVILTVTLAETFIAARNLIGDRLPFHAEYRYQIDRADDATLFISSIDDKGRVVYLGIVHNKTGAVRLTKSSAFPAHSTRVRVADRALRCLFAGQGERIEAAGWSVTAEVLDDTVGF